MTRPALGDAITLVPGVATGGGSGESDLKRGWMCDSQMDPGGVSDKSSRLRDAGLKLRLRGRTRGGWKCSGVVGLDARVEVGLAKIASGSYRIVSVGVDASITARRM